MGVLESVQRHAVAYAPVVPTMLMYLLQHSELRRFNLKSLRRVIGGGTALPEALRSAFEEAAGCRVEQVYGLSKH
jgi:long-chain acyl-CoA synthetase